MVLKQRPAVQFDRSRKSFVIFFQWPPYKPPDHFFLCLSFEIKRPLVAEAGLKATEENLGPADAAPCLYLPQACLRPKTWSILRCQCVLS